MWRQDYVAHPRNPSGEISRKIKNENDLLKAVKESLPELDVRGIQTCFGYGGAGSDYIHG